MPPVTCPCCSGRSYKECCAPYHRLVCEAPDAVSLMRSRYAAFARKEVAYLVRTLHSAHDDRAASEAALLRSLRDACATNRYMGLQIVDHAPPDAGGIARVIFAASVFVRGVDRSFVECSDFAHDGAGFRYLAGLAVARSRVTGDVMALTIATFADLEAGDRGRAKT